MITLIAACSANRTIGKDNTIVWKVPGDLKRFKELTTGKTVLMGRKTYDSIGRPLPNRKNVVISRQPDLQIEGCLVYNNLPEALNLLGFAGDLYVIGGEEIYRQSLPYADKIELTYIEKVFEGDAFFPEIPFNFKITNIQKMDCEEFKYSYITYESL